LIWIKRHGEEDMQCVAHGFGLIEGPVWDPDHGLYFSDVINGGVHLLDRAGEVSLVVPKRRGIGGMALHAEGGLVMGGRDIALVSMADGRTRSLLALDAIPAPPASTISPPTALAAFMSARSRFASSAARRPSPAICT